MPEIFTLGNRVTVMRDGATVETVDVAGTTAQALIAAMVGRRLEERVPKRAVEPGAVALEVAGLQRGPLGPLGFEVRAGEIFGLAGLMGSGRTEVARAIFGADPPTAGEVRVGGQRLDGSVRRRHRRRGGLRDRGPQGAGAGARRLGRRQHLARHPGQICVGRA